MALCASFARKIRNVGDRCYCRLKDFRGIATRYDKLARHFAAFVGFIAALVAVTATTVELVAADLHPHSMSPAWQGFGFITAIIGIVAILITLFSGLLSRGTQRIALVSCGIVAALTYLFGLVSHFGD